MRLGKHRQPDTNLFTLDRTLVLATVETAIQSLESRKGGR